MDVRAALRSQFHAALAMLEHAVRACPDEMWDDPADANRFWHVAYHVLFYVDFYASDDQDAFAPWPGHRPDHHVLGARPWPPFDRPVLGPPYDVAAILDYVAYNRQRVDDTLAAVDLDAPSGFPWLPMGKLELQLYSLRHLQQHTGELMERLGARSSVDVPWVGMGDG